VTAPGADTPPPADVSAAPALPPPELEPTPAGPPIVDVTADPMMMQVIQGSEGTRGEIYFGAEGDQ
jgi:hypothetical protein